MVLKTAIWRQTRNDIEQEREGAVLTTLSYCLLAAPFCVFSSLYTRHYLLQQGHTYSTNILNRQMRNQSLLLLFLLSFQFVYNIEA